MSNAVSLSATALGLALAAHRKQQRAAYKAQRRNYPKCDRCGHSVNPKTGRCCMCPAVYEVVPA